MARWVAAPGDDRRGERPLRRGGSGDRGRAAPSTGSNRPPPTPRAVISAPGLLAPFNDGGVLSPLDVHAAAAAARLCGEADPRVVLAAALAVRGARLGNVCIDLAAQRGAVAVDGQDPEGGGRPPVGPTRTDGRRRSSPAAWPAAGEKGRPLVMEGGRLYLDRYFRYEDRVAGLIESRAAAPPDRLDPEVEAALDRLLPPVEGGAPNLQHRAARTALTGRFTVIAAGPAPARHIRWRGCWPPWRIYPPGGFRGRRCAHPRARRPPGWERWWRSSPLAWMIRS